MKARFLLPLGVLVALVALFAVGLNIDPRRVPSPLVGKPAPDFSLPQLEQPTQTITRAELTQHKVALFNVWASWCVACRQEHPFLMELARRGEVPIYGLNYKDERVAALGVLRTAGNPYRNNAFDADGRVGIDWGVYGVPETFVVDGNGIIRYKQIGPLTEQDWRETVEPLVRRLQEQTQ